MMPPNAVTPLVQERLAKQYPTMVSMFLSPDAFSYTYTDDEGNELILRTQDGWIVYEEHPSAHTQWEYSLDGEHWWQDTRSPREATGYFFARIRREYSRADPVPEPPDPSN